MGRATRLGGWPRSAIGPPGPERAAPLTRQSAVNGLRDSCAAVGGGWLSSNYFCSRVFACLRVGVAAGCHAGGAASVVVVLERLVLRLFLAAGVWVGFRLGCFLQVAFGGPAQPLSSVLLKSPPPPPRPRHSYRRFPSALDFCGKDVRRQQLSCCGKHIRPNPRVLIG